MRTARILVALLVVAGIGYTAYVGYEGSRQVVELSRERTADCRTPDVAFGWDYEAINYDGADDERLASYPDRLRCPSQGSMAGDDVVASDGTPIAGWYVPAQNAPEQAATVILVHGHGATKSAVLAHAAGLHAGFNLVFVDLRNGGRSGDTQTTMGVLEQLDVRAIVDWLEREKRADRIGVLGDSMGAATALALAVEDSRVDALILDSVHRSLSDNLAQRLSASGHPAYPGVWAILAGAHLRTGVDLTSADPVATIARYGDRPLLFIHGTADAEDLPVSVEGLLRAARNGGTSGRIEWCEGATHGQPAHHCPDAYGEWTASFFTDALERP
jgi:uncharacterized protein